MAAAAVGAVAVEAAEALVEPLEDVAEGGAAAPAAGRTGSLTSMY